MAAATGGAGEEISHATGWDTGVTSVEAKASAAVEAEVIIMAAAAKDVATVPGNLRSQFQVISKPNGCQTGVLQPFGMGARTRERVGGMPVTSLGRIGNALEDDGMIV